jgi:hypothetical protein
MRRVYRHVKPIEITEFLADDFLAVDDDEFEGGW